MLDATTTIYGPRSILVAEFPLIEHGARDVPAHLADKVDCITKMLEEFSFAEVRTLWRDYVADGGGPCEGEPFLIRCVCWHRAIDAKFRAAFGMGLRAMAEDTLQKEGPT